MTSSLPKDMSAFRLKMGKLNIAEGKKLDRVCIDDASSIQSMSNSGSYASRSISRSSPEHFSPSEKASENETKSLVDSCKSIPSVCPQIRFHSVEEQIKRSVISFFEDQEARLEREERMARRIASKKSSAGIHKQMVCSFLYSLEVPKIGIGMYLRRIIRKLDLSSAVVLSALIYICRIVDQGSPKIPLSMYTIHRLCLSGLSIATKYVEDLTWSNKHFANVGGSDPLDLQSAEVEFLFGLKFNLHISAEGYERCAAAIGVQHILQEAQLVKQ